MISASGTTTTLWSNCLNYYNVACYSGGVSATCSTGKRLLGGGCYTNNAYRSNIRDSSPATATTWQCSANSELNSTTIWAYAICARIQ
jgi:hypothetical protein